MIRKITAFLLCICMVFAFCANTFAVSCGNYSSWFQSEYNEMNQLGLIPSTFSGFDLTQKISRQEMCDLAVHAFEKITKDSITPSRTDYFSDTQNETILKAYELGIVSGYPDGTFKGNQLLTRQEFFQIIKNFCNAAAFKPTSENANLSTFNDASAVANWALEAAKICCKCGYVAGSATNGGLYLMPDSTTSRQEAMAMFLRCYKGLNEYYYGLVHSATVQSDNDDDVTVSDCSETLYVNTGTLNVRDSWTTSSTCVGELNRGDCVKVTGKCSNGWYRISFNGNIAYVKGKYLSDKSGKVEKPEITGGGAGVEIANYVMQFVGYPYVYAGASPSVGFDCSGLIYYCFGQFGYSMSRVADDQMDQGSAVSRDDLQVGDLVFFGYGDYSEHVGMYIGGGNFVHASTPSSGVRIDSLDQTYYANKYLGARRIIN